MILPDPVVLQGANMLFVAAVLFIIARTLDGKVGAVEQASFAFLCGLLNIASAFYYGFIMGDAVSLGGFLLFGFTYWMLAINTWFASDTWTGLGWYCFFVVLATLPFIFVNFWAGAWVGGIFWVLWGFLWGCFWVLNGLKAPILRFTSIATYGVALVNGIVGAAFMFGWLIPTGLPV